MAEEKKKEKFKLDVRAQAPEFRANIEDLQNKANYGNRQDDTTIVNSDGANASVRLTDNKVNIASSQDSGFKVNEQQTNMLSFEEKHVTNRFNLDTYEIIVNGHKLNPNLWEYSDMAEFKDFYQTRHAVGGLCMFGSVICPTWDEQLHRYVLVRRLARMPIFSSKLNVPEIMKQLNIQDPTKVAYHYGYKQATESADEFQKKAADKVKTKEDKKDGDAPEQVANGRHQSEDDSKKTRDENRGMTREQAVEKLKKEPKYTRPWEKDKGYTDGKGHGDDVKADATTAESGETKVNEADAKDGDATDGAKGPNGRKYFENDIKYLMDQNKDMTREQAIDILSKDPKYTKKWQEGKGYVGDQKADSASSSSSTSSDGGSAESSSGSATKAENGKPYVNDADISWQVMELSKPFERLDENFKAQVAKAMAEQAKAYGTSRAAKHVEQARQAVLRQSGEANKQYAQWLNDIEYYLNQVEYQKSGKSSSSSSIPSGKADAQSEEKPKVEQTTKAPEKPVQHQPASTESRTEPKATSPARDDGSTFKNKPTPKQPEPAPRVQQKKTDDFEEYRKKKAETMQAVNSQQQQIFQKMLQIIGSYTPQSQEEIMAVRGVKTMLMVKLQKAQGNTTEVTSGYDFNKIHPASKALYEKLSLVSMNEQLTSQYEALSKKIAEMDHAYDEAHGRL